MFDPQECYRYTPLRTSGNNLHFDDPCLTKSTLYKFKASNNCVYHIVAEEYLNKYYFVKFYPSKWRDRENKFKVRTGKQSDTSKIIGTCVRVVVDLMKKHPDHVYGFFGQWDSIDLARNREFSQRFAIYKKITASYFPVEKFLHLDNPGINVFMIADRRNMNNKFVGNIVQEIMAFMTPEKLGLFVMPNQLDDEYVYEVKPEDVDRTIATSES